MKKKDFFTWPKRCGTLLMGAAALLMASCAVDGFDDETFVSDVRNAQLSSPEEEDIKSSTSTDGKSMTITWPVIQGAGGYLVSFYDEGNPDEYIVTDSIVDGCSITVPREEDVNYKFVILTLGNLELNNTTAETATEKKISTFTPTYLTIPTGSDLNEWFAANPIPEEAIYEMKNYDLEAGGEYTISDVLDFDAYRVTLRTNSKDNHAKITYTTENSGITTTAQMGIKYLDFDCSPLPNNKGVFAFSKETSVPAANTIDPATYKWTGALITDPIVISSCNFDNVGGYFFWDNAAKTWAATMLVDNCVVHLTPQSSIGGGVFWTNKAGQINDLTVSNCTFYEDPDCAVDYKYFYQAGLVKGPDLYADNAPEKATATNTLTYSNCTFYHVTWNSGQWGNYNGMNGKATSYWVMTNCIFYDCSTSGSVPRRFLHGQSYASSPKNKTFNYNTYMNNDGTFQDPQNYDESGTIIEEDPQFANPAAGDFTIGASSKQAALKTGDPRWLP